MEENNKNTPVTSPETENTGAGAGDTQKEERDYYERAYFEGDSLKELEGDEYK